ncbi:GlxA family transcriptional regulator [Arthrobacter crystallopoietes]|uniref:Transcriptional regulator GlxA family, contains an amidase domain and an AraC-type DNA-binding HTH domain n=1 Tax=Crystallibacter crystallopoietes TaxID=37928 RepID=A0A1H0ZSZ9_9MICC|nr:helix-turn-helix domain-containing protein [Arthrobacter crystallopoietes]SDQ30492.1 Transcriptional regulator GlxA family, contains an amidase domain and an AraC-type DNA-binding HTH domain [Arthrobacter crystallopoietes]
MRIAVYAFEGVTMFHLAVPQMVFGEVARQGLAEWETVLFTDDGDAIRTAEGYQIGGLAGLDAAAAADVVVIPSWDENGKRPSGELAGALQQAHGQGATVVGLCLGAFALADSGLLAARPAVTHWHALDAFSQHYPDIPVDRTVLYIDHGDVLTSAGTAAGIDACLHIVRSRLGAEAANHVARSLVVAPHRSGGQAQYIERPILHPGGTNPIAEALDWAIEHLGDKISVDDLAKASHMSRRSFIRAFRAATGTTPATWLRARRLDEVRRLLEITDLPIDRIAAQCGFSSPITMRQNFMSEYATTPSEYRRRFSASAPSPYSASEA